jgi:hypothetical protein
MANSLNRIDFPEIIFGFVAPIGANIEAAVGKFGRFFEEMQYDVIVIKATDAFLPLSTKLPPQVQLNNTPKTFDRFDSFIKYGNQLRAHFDDDAFLAMIACAKIMRARAQAGDPTKRKPEKKVYLIHQFKRKEEVALLRSVYGRIFIHESII